MSPWESCGWHSSNVQHSMRPGPSDKGEAVPALQASCVFTRTHLNIPYMCCLSNLQVFIKTAPGPDFIIKSMIWIVSVRFFFTSLF